MKILFICKGNMFRSVMAEAIAAKLIGKENVFSEGTYVGAIEEPVGQKITDLQHLHPYIDFMKERGFDISNHTTRRFEESTCDNYDVVVNMSEDRTDSVFLNTNSKVVKWEVENPLFQNYTPEDAKVKCEEIYEIIEKKIRELVGR